MGHFCPAHQVVHGQEAWAIHELVLRYRRAYKHLKIAVWLVRPDLGDIPDTDSSLPLPVPPGRFDGECRWGCVCYKHDCVHGMEARLIRSEIEWILQRAESQGRATFKAYRLGGLIRRIGPTDTLAWLEVNYIRTLDQPKGK